LLIANFFGALYSLNVSVLNARGESKRTFNLELIKKSLILISVILCFSYGIKAMLLGYVFACFISYFLSMVFIKRSLNHYFKHQFADIVPNLLLAVFLGGIAALLGLLTIANLILVIVQLLVVAILYLFIVRFFYPDTFSQAFLFAKSRLKFKN